MIDVVNACAHQKCEDPDLAISFQKIRQMIPQLDQFLKKQKIQYLIITGIFTEGCVLATAANGFSAGYNFIFLKDLIETADAPRRQKLSRLLKKQVFPLLYGKTMTSKEFLKSFSLSRTA